jgi:hypothetical protein
VSKVPSFTVPMSTPKWRGPPISLGEKQKSVFVIMPQPRLYIAIPKRAFSEEQISEFRELLRRNVGKK